MGYTDSQRMAISEHLAFRKERAIELDQQRGRWLRRYKKELMENGNSIPDARAVVLKQFDECTDRKLDNALRYGSSANPGADVMTEGRVLIHLSNMEQDIEVQCNEYDRQLDEMDDKEALGEDLYYEVEVTEHTGGKESKVITKKVPMSEARHLILSRKASARERYFVAVKNLRGGTIINIDNRSITADMSMEDLDREINELEGKHKIRGEVTIVETD